MSDAADGTPSRHARPRRPGPLGPRRPSAGAIGIPPRNASAPAIPTIGHVRQASAARSHSHLRQQPSEVLALPRFKKTPIPWRGYTLEVAKWTFTSEQLQAIVSRAIRQSGEASTLRLMPLEVLDSDVPNELARREAREADLKNTYKYMVRKREGMLASLARATDATHSPDITTVHRMLGELSTLGANMDETVEELHEVSDQIAQLRRLRDVHSYSALAMALRKLNTSFLKQVAETQELRQQIRVLEVERDDAWRQAEDLAQEVDYLDAFMAESARSGTRSAGTPGSSRAATFAPLPLQDDAHDIKVMTATTASARSSRVSASRKTSVRKAGLRRGVSARRSARSSAASATTAGSASRLTFYDDAPPVPPLPLPRRNLAISTTQLHDRLSGSGPTTETPSSEMEAMVLAQRELYDMLGLPRDELLVTSPGQEGRPRSAVSYRLFFDNHVWKCSFLDLGQRNSPSFSPLLHRGIGGLAAFCTAKVAGARLALTLTQRTRSPRIPACHAGPGCELLRLDNRRTTGHAHDYQTHYLINSRGRMTTFVTCPFISSLLIYHLYYPNAFQSLVDFFSLWHAHIVFALDARYHSMFVFTLDKHVT